METKTMDNYTGITIQEIFEMRKMGLHESAYVAASQKYKEHQGHYTTLCKFWTASDVCRARIETWKLDEAEKVIGEMTDILPKLIDRDGAAKKAVEKLLAMLNKARNTVNVLGVMQP